MDIPKVFIGRWKVERYGDYFALKKDDEIEAVFRELPDGRVLAYNSDWDVIRKPEDLFCRVMDLYFHRQ